MSAAKHTQEEIYAIKSCAALLAMQNDEITHVEWNRRQRDAVAEYSAARNKSKGSQNLAPAIKPVVKRTWNFPVVVAISKAGGAA